MSTERNDCGFHLHSGFYWKRDHQGTVILTKTTTQGVKHYQAGLPVPDGIDPEQRVADWTLNIDPDSWVSIVAYVSVHPASREEAWNFHMREPR